MNYIDFYNKYSIPLLNYKKWIKLLNLLLTYLFYVLYPLLILTRLHDTRIIHLIVYPGISFVLLSYIRKKINKKRPYECGLKAILNKNTKGNSMPSRHVFSAVVISMCYLWIYPKIGILLLILSFFEGIVRIIGGVHYPIDIIVGYFVAVLVGGLMIL